MKLIYFNYKASKYFVEIYPFFEKLLNKSFDYLFEWNAYTIIEIARFIGITTPIEFDYRNKYPDLEIKLSNVEKGDYNGFEFMQNTRPIKKVARIIAICKKEGAETYINALGGMDLYDKNEFASYGIDIKFIKTDEIIYQQFSKEFVPNLSIIDVLMHNGREGAMKLIKKYTLI